MNGLRLSRRSFLQAALAQATALGLLSQVGCGGRVGDDKKDDKGDGGDLPFDFGPALTGYFGTELLESAGTIGARYLGTVAPGASDGDLEALLESTRGLIEDSPSDEEAIQTLLDSVRADFAGAQVLTLSGWTLSLTELRLCALAHLHAA